MRYAGFLAAAAAVTTFAIVGRITIDELPLAVRASRMVNISSTQAAPYVVPAGRTLVLTGIVPSGYAGQSPVALVTVNGALLLQQEMEQKGVTLPPNLFAPSGSAVLISGPIPASSAGTFTLTGYLD